MNTHKDQQSSSQDGSSFEPKKGMSRNSKIVLAIVITLLIGGFLNYSKKVINEKKFDDDAMKMIKELQLEEEIGISAKDTGSKDYNFKSIEIFTDFAKTIQLKAEEANVIIEDYFEFQESIDADPQAARVKVEEFKKEWEEIIKDVKMKFNKFENELNTLSPQSLTEKEFIEGMQSSFNDRKIAQFNLFDKMLDLFDIELKYIDFLVSNSDLYVYDEESGLIDSDDDEFYDEYYDLLLEYDDKVEEYNELIDKLISKQEAGMEKFKQYIE